MRAQWHFQSWTQISSLFPFPFIFLHFLFQFHHPTILLRFKFSIIKRRRLQLPFIFVCFFFPFPFSWLHDTNMAPNFFNYYYYFSCEVTVRLIWFDFFFFPFLLTPKAQKKWKKVKINSGGDEATKGCGVSEIYQMYALHLVPSL